MQTPVEKFLPSALLPLLSFLHIATLNEFMVLFLLIASVAVAVTAICSLTLCLFARVGIFT